MLSIPLDRKQSWNINPVKCFKKCTDDGTCTFNAHFWRYFATDDALDFQLDENEDRTFYMMGYFETYDLEYEGKRRYNAGQGDDIKVLMGRIRDYEVIATGAV